MKRLAIFSFSALLAMSVSAQVPQKGVALLFKSGGKQLSLSDKGDIFEQLDLRITEDGKKLVDSTCDDVEFRVEVRLVDLNSDKVPEVAVSGGNTCTSGATGGSIWLFIKDAEGHYHKNLGFPAAGYRALKSRSKGFPDLQFGGMGFCEGVWRWSGTEYSFLRNQPTAKGGCDGRGP